VIFAEDIIRVEHLSFEETIPPQTNERSPAAEGIKLPVDLNEIIAATEREYLLEAKSKYKSSREIAKALGVSHTTVINKIKTYGL
jgi:transcriptional regulator of aroF, aroG, tyrA and aromatic amino acid transport